MLKEAIKEACISCGRDDCKMYHIKGAFSDDYKVCAKCKLRFEGKSGLAAEADRLMTEWTFEPSYTCLKCGTPVLVRPGSEVPLYCHECLCEIHRCFKGFVQ